MFATRLGSGGTKMYMVRPPCQRCDPLSYDGSTTPISGVRAVGNMVESIKE